MKKIIFSSIIVLLAAFLAVQAQAALPRGINIKTGGNSSVYYYDNGGAKHLYPDMATLLSWYPDGKFNIKTVTKKEFNSMPTAKNSRVKEGTLLKFGRQPSVYRSIAYGQLCYAASADFADRNFGSDWRRKILNTSVKLSDYQIVGPCLEKNEKSVGCHMFGTSSTIDGLKLDIESGINKPTTDAEKTDVENAYFGIKNIIGGNGWYFNNWEFTGSLGKLSITNQKDYLTDVSIQQLSFASEQDLLAAREKLISSGSTSTYDSHYVLSEMIASNYDSCRIAGHQGNCLIIDPSILVNERRQVCLFSESSSSPSQSDISSACKGLFVPAQLTFIYSQGLELWIATRSQMLNSKGKVFASTTDEIDLPIAYPESYIMHPDQSEQLLAPFINYLDQCQSLK